MGCPYLLRIKYQGLHILNARGACPAQRTHLPGEETEAGPGGDRKSSGMGAAWPGQSGSLPVRRCVASGQPGPFAGRPALWGAAKATFLSPPPPSCWVPRCPRRGEIQPAARGGGAALASRKP